MSTHPKHLTLVISGLHKRTQKQWSMVQKFVAACVPNITRQISQPKIDDTPVDEAFCVMTCIFCQSKQQAYYAYEEIDTAFGLKTSEKFGLQSDYLRICFETGKPKYDSKQTLILNGLHIDLRNEWDRLVSFVKAATSYVLNISEAIEVRVSGGRELKLMAYLYYESPEISRSAKTHIENELVAAASKRDDFFKRVKVSCMIEPSTSDTESELKGEDHFGSPMDFFRRLKAHSSIKLLFRKMHIINDGTKRKRKKNGILISGTGTGKTIGTAILAGMSGIKIFIVVPKTVQVDLLVYLLKSLFNSSKRIGSASGGNIDYDLTGAFDIIVVTYGHFLRKLVKIFANFDTGHACITATSHGISGEFSDYLVVLDEVHEPFSEIQSVLLLSERIENQKIIISATVTKQSILEYAGPESSFVTVEHEVDRMFPTQTIYEPVEDAARRSDTIQAICRITRRYIDRSEAGFISEYKADRDFFGEDGKIIIFVPGVSYIDWVISTLIRERIVYAYEISEAHSELWEDQIMEAVSNYRVIVATNILESSVTIHNLKVVIDTMLKNEVAGDELRESLVSKAEAQQRSGRVGRTAPGITHRLMRQMREYVVIRGFDSSSSRQDIEDIVNSALDRVKELEDCRPIQISIEERSPPTYASKERLAVLSFIGAASARAASIVHAKLIKYFPGGNSRGRGSGLKISDVCKGYGCLPDYPAQPFALNDPHSEFLLLSQTFGFKSEVEEILRLEPDQAGRCKTYLKQLGAVRHGKLTSFGKKLLGLPLSIKYACPVAHMFSPPVARDLGARGPVECGRPWQMFALVMALAFENLPTWLFDVPRNMRVERDGASIMCLVRDASEEFACGCLVGTVLKIFLHATFRSGALSTAVASSSASLRQALLPSERIDRRKLRAWCSDKRLNSKYVNRVLVSLMRACESTFRGDIGFGRNSSLADFEPMRGLRDLFLINDEQRFRRNLHRGLEAFEPYFCGRFIHLEVTEGQKPPPEDRAGAHFFEVSAGFAEAELSLIERATRNGPFPVLCGALRRRKRHRAGREGSIELTGVFPASLKAFLRLGLEGDTTAQAQVAEALRRLAVQGDNERDMLVRSGAVEAMVRMGGVDRDGATPEDHKWLWPPLAGALRSLAAAGGGCADRVAGAEGAVELLGTVARRGAAETAEDAASALHCLAAVCGAARRALAASGWMRYAPPTPAPPGGGGPRLMDAARADADGIAHALECREPQAAMHRALTAVGLFRAALWGSSGGGSAGPAAAAEDWGGDLACTQEAQGEAVRALWAMVKGILWRPRFRKNVIARRRHFAAADGGAIRDMLDLCAGGVGSPSTARDGLEQYAALIVRTGTAVSTHAFPYPSLFALTGEEFLGPLCSAHRAVTLLAPALGSSCAARVAAACAAAKDHITAASAAAAAEEDDLDKMAAGLGWFFADTPGANPREVIWAAAADAPGSGSSSIGDSCSGRRGYSDGVGAQLGGLEAAESSAGGGRQDVETGDRNGRATGVGGEARTQAKDR